MEARLVLQQLAEQVPMEAALAAMVVLTQEPVVAAAVPAQLIQLQ
jgi:hypothetical protein